MSIDVEVYDIKEDSWAQATYLVHGYDDILWTNDPEEAAAYVGESIIKLSEAIKGE